LWVFVDWAGIECKGYFTSDLFQAGALDSVVSVFRGLAHSSFSHLTFPLAELAVPDVRRAAKRTRSGCGLRFGGLTRSTTLEASNVVVDGVSIDGHGAECSTIFQAHFLSFAIHVDWDLSHGSLHGLVEPLAPS